MPINIIEPEDEVQTNNTNVVNKIDPLEEEGPIRELKSSISTEEPLTERKLSTLTAGGNGEKRRLSVQGIEKLYSIF